MPVTCETKDIYTQSESNCISGPYLDRRNFLSLAATAAIGAVLSNLLLSRQVFAVTAAEKQAEADAVRARLDEWNILLDQYTTDYYRAVDEHDRAVQLMDAAQARIDEINARLTELQGQLNFRARTMYKQGPLSFLDVIFGSSSFVEFTTSWDLLNSINNRDAQLIQECKDLRAEAEQAKEEYTQQEQIALQKMIEAEDIQREAQAIQAAFVAELERLDDEVRQLIEEERRAEEERLRREEEERQRQQQAAPGGNPGGYVPYSGQTYGSIVEAAYDRLGCPYVWAASGPNAFDCSGLTSWCYKQVGIYIPRGGNDQYLLAPMRHEVWEAQPGDILYKPGHVGLYVGGGQFIHAPRPGDVVRIANVAGYGWVGASRWGY